MNGWIVGDRRARITETISAALRLLTNSTRRATRARVSDEARRVATAHTVRARCSLTIARNARRAVCGCVTARAHVVNHLAPCIVATICFADHKVYNCILTACSDTSIKVNFCSTITARAQTTTRTGSGGCRRRHRGRRWRCHFTTSRVCRRPTGSVGYVVAINLRQRLARSVEDMTAAECIMTIDIALAKCRYKREAARRALWDGEERTMTIEPKTTRLRRGCGRRRCHRGWRRGGGRRRRCRRRDCRARRRERSRRRGRRRARRFRVRWSVGKTIDNRTAILSIKNETKSKSRTRCLTLLVVLWLETSTITKYFSTALTTASWTLARCRREYSRCIIV